jgi:non-ribosomal peptide synthetase component F
MENREPTKTVVDFFEENVLKYPDMVAVKGSRESRTYQELNSWSNGIGERLLENNDTRPIILSFQHQDIEIVAATMGALKAGIPFTLSPPLTYDELRELIAKVGAGTVITRGVEKPAIEVGPVKFISALDFRDSHAKKNLGIKLDPESTAHLGNTSGTTGEPKLAVITHRTELFQSWSRVVGTGVEPGDKVSLMRLNSAAAARDILVGLTSGASVYILDIGQEDLLRDVAEWIVEEKINVLFCHIPIFQRIATSQVPHYPHVKVLQLCGGAATVGDFRVYQKYFPDSCRFLNRYGLTETGSVAWLFADKNHDFKGGLRDYIPVGKPFPGAKISIVEGEIHVTSDFLSMYWDRPDLNSEKFYRDSDGNLTFRTGDLGRYGEDGNLMHLGRVSLNKPQQ